MNHIDRALSDATRQVYIDGYLLCAQHVEDWLRMRGLANELTDFLRQNASTVQAGFAISKAKGEAS